MFEATFEARFKEWLKECQELVNKHYAENFASLKPALLTYEKGGKLIKVISTNDEGRGQSSVWAFVSFETYTTKALGQIQTGDILKPATWKAPAKHARGNLFDDKKGMGSIGVYGPQYIRGPQF